MSTPQTDPQTDPQTNPQTDRVRPVAQRRQRWAAGLLVLGGLSLAASQVVQPRGDSDVFALSLAQHSAAWTAWGLLIMASGLLQLPAVVSFRSSATTGAGARPTAVGAAITFVALVALFAFGAEHASLAALVGSPPVAPEVLTAFERLDAAPSLAICAILGLFGFHLGWPILLAGLARAGRVPSPLAVVGGAAIFLSLFGSVLGPVGETALFLLGALSLVAVGATCWPRSTPSSHDR